MNFTQNLLLWTLALYGAFEIIKTIIMSYFCKRKDTYMIVTTKNAEDCIEGILRLSLFTKSNYIKKIIVVDMNSVDDTKKIVINLEKQIGDIKLVDWNECKQILNNSNFK